MLPGVPEVTHHDKTQSSRNCLGILSLLPAIAKADELNIMGTADNFAVLGASTVTNTGSSVLTGSLGCIRAAPSPASFRER
jgi:hypothetical protein